MKAAPRLTGTISVRVRNARRDSSLTLLQVSQRSGVSISTLSKIENAHVLPSFDIIKKICDGLNLAIEDIIREPETISNSGRKTTTRQGDASPFSSGEYDYFVHATELARKWMVPMEIIVRAHSPDEFDHWSQHNGEEFVYVLSGAIEIHTNEYAPFILKAGDSSYFDSTMKHLYVSVGEEDARILSVSCDPAQKRHNSPYIKPKVPMEVDNRPASGPLLSNQ